MNTVYRDEIRNVVKSDLPWHELQNSSILITGASGFIASFITHVLLQANTEYRLGLKVYALVRNRVKAEKKFAEYGGRACLQLLVRDINSPLPQKTGHVDIIIHAASPASPRSYGNDPVGTILPNVLGTCNVLDYARTHNAAQLIYLSSSEVYGRVDAKAKIREADYGYLDPLDLRSCYAESKRMGENMCLAWFTQHKVPIKIVRLFHTYGPGMSLSDGRVFADFVANVVRNESIVIKGQGKARRAFCYLTDAVRGLFTVLFKGEYGQAYNIGDEQGVLSIKELAGLLAALFPDKNLKVSYKTREDGDPYLPSGVNRVCPDTAKIRKLGWQAQVGLREGFARTVRSFMHEPSV